MKSVSRVVLLFLLALVVHPFSAEGLLLTATKQRLNNHSNPDLQTTFESSVSRVKPVASSTALASASEGSMIATNTISSRAARIPKILWTLNAATKWLVSLAVSVGVFWNPRHFRGPYIVVGSIAANYLAGFLKRLINQGRPPEAPFADPGMPSSHALVSFFVAMSWNHALHSGVILGTTTPWLVGSAVMVSALRVICGYHTLAQIAVGGTLGTLLAHAWMTIGAVLEQQNHKVAHAVSWSAYVVGSAIYIQQNLMRWVTDEKYL